MAHESKSFPAPALNCQWQIAIPTNDPNCFFRGQMLKKISTEESLEDRSTSELDALKHRDWVSLDDTHRVCVCVCVLKGATAAWQFVTCAASAAVCLQARLWVQLMKELRQGVKLKKVQEQPFDPLPTEFSLTPFEMLMQDIRARKFQLRKVMVSREAPQRQCATPRFRDLKPGIFLPPPDSYETSSTSTSTFHVPFAFSTYCNICVEIVFSHLNVCV